MKLNKGLNLDTHPSNAETGDYRYAQNISLDNTMQYPINEKGLQELGANFNFANIAGTIPYDKGIVFFANTNHIYVVDTSTQPEVLKQTLKVNLEFLPEKPIRGTYTYNQNGDLIICFSSGVNGNFEDKIINLNAYDSHGSYYELNTKENHKLNINPDVVFPEVTSEIINGNLMTGSYQIAISYFIDKEYTNHSLLSLPVYIYGTNNSGDGGKDGLAPYQVSTKGIKYTFVNLDNNYTHYRISVIYNDGTTFKVYTTSNITTLVNEYVIDDLFKLNIGSLDDTLINSIFYSNSESMSVMNNRLYRANLKGQNVQAFDSVASKLASNVSLELKEQIIDKNTISLDKQYIKFQNDEVYALYLTLGDKKGNILGSYPINTVNTKGLYTSNKRLLLNSDITLTFSGTDNRAVKIELEKPAITDVKVLIWGYTLSNEPISFTLTIFKNTTINNGFITTSFPPNINSFQIAIQTVNYLNVDNNKKYYEIPKENTGVDGSEVRYTTNHIEVSLPLLQQLNIDANEQLELDKIGFWCVHRAQRNNSNSKIYTQGISCAPVDFGYNYKLFDNIVKPNAFHYANSSDLSIFLPNQYYGWGDSANFINYKQNLRRILRFYSFEDLYNKNDNFPSTKYNILSKYNITINPANSNFSFNNTEKIFNLEDNIVSSKLIEGNNLAAYNPCLESSREIIGEDIDSVYSFIPNTTQPALDRNKAHRLNIFNITTEYYKYIYDEILVLSSNIKKFQLSTVYTTETLNSYGDTFYSIFKLILKRLDTSAYKLGSFVNDIYAVGSENINDLTNPSWYNSILKTINITSFIESKYNIHARYWEGDYPDWEQPINTATQTGYNKVYNLQNTQNATTVIDINNNEDRLTNKGLYPSRIVMSKTKSQESNVLNFRKYLALDYYDMPYNRNAIVALNSTYKNLYIQQELALSVASVKDIISYQDGATYVGSGQLFDRQPTEIIPTGYGFLGCENYFNTGITDLGLWVIDNVQSLITLINDDSVKIISNGKNQNWFNGKLKGNNPFIGDGCFITYDNSDKQLKRLILTIQRQAKSISYIPSIENWLSFHSYNPIFGVYTRNNTYFLFRSGDDYSNLAVELFNLFANSNGIFYDYNNEETSFPFESTFYNVSGCKLYKYSDTLKAKFSDDNNPFKSIISLYYNEDKGINKLFETLYWQTKFIIDDVDIYDKTFTELFIHNDSQSTNIVNIGNNNEWFNSENGVMKQELWMFNKLFDYVKDNRKPFLSDFINFVNDNFNYSKEWFDISKIMSIFACVTMMFDNYYYSTDGKQKSITPTEICVKQPTLLLNDLLLTYKKVNR